MTERKDNRHWSQINESTVAWGIRILCWIFRLGGRVTFFATLWPVIFVYWLFLPRLRAASLGYLTRVHASGYMAKKPGWIAGISHVVRFADTIMDKILAVSGAFTVDDLEVHGREPLLADERGAVLITCHSGCLELCQALTQSRPRHKVVVLVHTLHAVKFNNILSRINENFAVNHIEVTAITPAIAITLSERVEAGEYIVIVGDRTPIASQAVTTAKFFGEEAPFPVGPYLLASLLKCPLWSMICTRAGKESKSRYALYFTKLWEPVTLSRKERGALFGTLAQRYADELEVRIGASPYDWFNFFDFWKKTEPVAQETQVQTPVQKHE